MLATLRSQVERSAGSARASEETSTRFGETDDALRRLTQRLDTLAATVESAGVEPRRQGARARCASTATSPSRAHASSRSSTTSARRSTPCREPELDLARRARARARAGRDGDARGRRRERRARGAELSAPDRPRSTSASRRSQRRSRARRRSGRSRSGRSRRGSTTPCTARRHEVGRDAPHRADASPTLPADDLLAGLRDSLQAMETVAAEMARASETLSERARRRSAARATSPNRERSPTMPDVEATSLRPPPPEARRSSRCEPASPDRAMLRPVDTLLLALGRFRPWARGRMVYRALAVLSVAERPATRGRASRRSTP